LEPVVADEAADLGHLLDAFLHEVKGVIDILVLGDNGLCFAAESALQPDDIDRMAANLSMLQALTTGAAQYLGSHNVLNTAVQSESGYLAMMRVDEQLLVAVIADRSCEIGHLVYELARLCDHIAAKRQPDGGLP
jgi:predicted regulator of Ras-like GTPase activity (Roadblock/LC7/MglB family)